MSQNSQKQSHIIIAEHKQLNTHCPLATDSESLYQNQKQIVPRLLFLQIGTEKLCET